MTWVLLTGEAKSQQVFVKHNYIEMHSNYAYVQYTTAKTRNNTITYYYNRFIILFLMIRREFRIV